MQKDALRSSRANCLIKSGEGSSNAKCILSGEHFVLYGQPAIVISIDKKLHIKSFIELDKNNSTEISDVN